MTTCDHVTLHRNFTHSGCLRNGVSESFTVVTTLVNVFFLRLEEDFVLRQLTIAEAGTLHDVQMSTEEDASSLFRHCTASPLMRFPCPASAAEGSPGDRSVVCLMSS